MSRKITFPSIGIEQGSRVWRNSETGVEIIKGKNFKEVGLYYVCVPTLDGAGRAVVGARTSLADARTDAMRVASSMREEIGEAYDAAVNEAIERREGSEAQMDQIAAWWRRHNIDGSTNYAASILAAREIDHAEAIVIERKLGWNAYWRRTLASGMPQVPAFR
jgi:hypothetical protein